MNGYVGMFKCVSAFAVGVIITVSWEVCSYQHSWITSLVQVLLSWNGWVQVQREDQAQWNVIACAS